MSGYVGRGINYGNAATDHFTGNGGATYTLNYDTTTDGVIVSLDGVVQKNGTDFNVTSGTSLVFTSVVASPIAIQVVYTGLTLSLGTPADGTVTPAKLTADTRSYFNRNDIINGGYLLNKENDTSATDDAYSIGDLFLYVGENSSTTSLQTSGGPQGDRNFARINIDNANAQAGWVYFLEGKDCQDYIANGALSFGVKAKTTANAIDTIRIGILKWTGTADSLTTDVVGTWASDGTDPTLATNWSYANTPSDLNLTTSWQRFTVENVTVDADTKNIAIFIWTDDGTITANDQLDVTEWQLNPGATVNDFHSPPMAIVEDQLSRYFQKVGNDTGVLYKFGIGTANTTGSCRVLHKFDKEMRVTPVATFLGTVGNIRTHPTNAAGSSSAFNNPDKEGVLVTITMATSPYNLAEAHYMYDGLGTDVGMKFDARL